MRCFHYQLQDSTVLAPFSSSIYHPLLFCPLFSLALWLIHLPPCCTRPNISISSILCSFLFKNHFLIHHPSCTAHCSQNTIPSVLYPILSFSMVFVFILHPPVFLPPSSPHFSTSSTDFSPLPLNPLFWFCVFTVSFTLFTFLIFLYFFFIHPLIHTLLVPHPLISAICHCSCQPPLASASSTTIISSLSLLNSAPTLTSPSCQ